MPDFRVHDSRPEDPRLREAGLASAGLWSLGGGHSMRDGTDGWLPRYYAAGWPGGLAAAKRLVTQRLWLPHRLGSRDGFLYDQEEWLREQRLAAEIAEAKERDAARARSFRRRRKDEIVRDSGQLTTGLIGVEGGRVTPNVTRDAPSDVAPNVTRDVTTERHGGRPTTPSPSPSPCGGYEEEEASGSERDPHAGGPTSLRSLSAPELERLDPRCSRHAQAEPGTPTPACSDCAIRKRAINDAVARATAGDLQARRSARTVELARAADCPDCDEYRWLLGTDGTPIDPPTRCTHPRLTEPDAPAATGTDPSP